MLVKDCTFSEISGDANFDKLVEGYAEECGMAGLPHPKAKIEMYHQLENSKVLHIIGAFLEETLIGFVFLVSPIIPHYSVQITTTESLFVGKEYRKTGAGIRLIKAAEEYAKRIGSPGVIMSAPIGGSLAELLPNIGYVETNRVFFRKLDNE